MGVLVELVSIGILLAFLLVSIGVIILRKTRPELRRPFRTPCVPLFPLIGAFSCLMLMLSLPWQNWCVKPVSSLLLLLPLLSFFYLDSRGCIMMYAFSSRVRLIVWLFCGQIVYYFYGRKHGVGLRGGQGIEMGVGHTFDTSNLHSDADLEIPLDLSDQSYDHTRILHRDGDAASDHQSEPPADSTAMTQESSEMLLSHELSDEQEQENARLS